MPTATVALEQLIEAELDVPIPDAVAAIAAAARARHGAGISAVLFYGSCYRDGIVEDRLVDLCLLADDYRSVHTNRISALANRLVPPNVYYPETESGGQTVRCKYAPLTMAQFAEGIKPRPRSWFRTRRNGKALSVLRLVKAAFTFTAGADYLAWKIERHSGMHIELTDWQRRHPILASPPILWRLIRSKAVRRGRPASSAPP